MYLIQSDCLRPGIVSRTEYKKPHSKEGHCGLEARSGDEAPTEVRVPHQATMAISQDISGQHKVDIQSNVVDYDDDGGQQERK
jgi:hypothetical protein